MPTDRDRRIAILLHALNVIADEDYTSISQKKDAAGEILDLFDESTVVASLKKESEETAKRFLEELGVKDYADEWHPNEPEEFRDDDLEINHILPGYPYSVEIPKSATNDSWVEEKLAEVEGAIAGNPPPPRAKPEDDENIPF